MVFVMEELLDGPDGTVLVVVAGADVFQLFTEVAAGGVRVFDHHGIGQAVVTLLPGAGDQLGRPQ